MSDPPAQPTFDRAAARARYRATMRGPLMRSMYVLLGVVLLVSWAIGIASVLAKDVEGLPGHDLTVPPARCLACHATAGGADSQSAPAPQVPEVAGLLPAPPMPHLATPTCGFCHRQSPPAQPVP
jgi:hypothetical protein